MNQREATAAILERWRTTWPGLTTAIVSGGVPSSVDNVTTAVGLPRAVVSVISLDSDEETLGPRAKVKREGFVAVRIYDEKNIGRGRSDEMVAHARTVFERRKLGRVGSGTVAGTLNRVITRAGTLNELRRDRDAATAWVVELTIPFDFWELVAR